MNWIVVSYAINCPTIIKAAAAAAAAASNLIKAVFGNNRFIIMTRL